MFPTLIYPSSGACDYAVELPHRSFRSWFAVCWRFCAVGFEFSLQHGHYSNPTATNLQHTAKQEQDDRCGNSTTQWQAPEGGYINVRNTLST